MQVDYFLPLEVRLLQTIETFYEDINSVIEEANVNSTIPSKEAQIPFASLML